MWWFVFSVRIHIDVKENGFMITHACHCVYGGELEIRDGFDVSNRSNIFSESNRVGSFIILTSPNPDGVSYSYGIGWREIHVRLLEMLCSCLEDAR